MSNAPFLERVHFTLSNAKVYGVSHILSWIEKGTSLQIDDPDELEEKKFYPTYPDRDPMIHSAQA
jgi:hypothetical protein